MKTTVFAVRDTKSESFGTPFFMPNRAMALRAFNDLAQDPKTTINKHPTDYVLFEIGYFEDENAEITPLKPVSLGFPKLPDELLDLSKLKPMADMLEQVK